MTAIWWIRRDVRLTDNAALHTALKAGSVLPVFVIDPTFAHSSPRRKDFLYEGLHQLERDLRERNSYLVARTGQAVDVLNQLVRETNAEAIYAEEDFTPYALQRDQEIARHLPLQLIHGQTVHHPNTILKSNGRPYTVFTPYSKAWKSRLPSRLTLIPAPEQIYTPKDIPGEPLPKFKVSPLFPSGEQEALVRLEEFALTPGPSSATLRNASRSPIGRGIHTYSEHRDRMDLDGTSALSPYLRFGMLGLRQAVSAAQQAIGQKRDTGAESWLNELIWREFYIQILYHFLHVRNTAFNPSLANIAWRNDESEFEAWKEGRTGVPIVDAGMRQLEETGWMHNRARMITASFLVKDLLIDWRWGEAWFMENLLDGDLAANNGGWQWTAGTGTDAAPYFRIFNPVLQSRNFDPNGDYIRKWVPALRGLDAKDIHAPWEKKIRVKGYPEGPIVERDKERTLLAYKLSKEDIRA
jgi:deoxyribodipyrimidine photo-lyase